MNSRYVRRLIIALIITVVIYVGITLHAFTSEPFGSSGFQPFAHKTDNPRTHLFSTVLETIIQYGPIGKSTRQYGEGCPEGAYGAGFDFDKTHYLSKENLAKCLQISKDEVEMLKYTHTEYVAAIKSLELAETVFSGDGIVTIGGGKYSMLAYQAVKMLRRAGSQLPIEVLIPPADDRDEEFCAEITHLNATCIYVDAVLEPATLEKINIDGYQTKAMAMLVSSFERILFLDSDNLALHNVDPLFNEPLFQETGLLLWPDFWRRKTNPVFYDILEKQVENVPLRHGADDISSPEAYSSEVPLHDLKGAIPDGSTESGQVLFDKKKHFSTLLLALYYNFYGPSWYYPITVQGDAGEGDKDTFIAAAHYFNMTYYQVKKPPRVDGYFNENGEFRGVAIIQADFRADYKQYLKAKEEIPKRKPVKEYEHKVFFNYFDDSLVPASFVHANHPKFDPVHSSIHSDFIDSNGHQYRLYRGGPKSIFDFDLESLMWEYTEDVLCTKGINFNSVIVAEANGHSKQQICDYLHRRVEYMKSSHSEYFG